MIRFTGGHETKEWRDARAGVDLVVVVIAVLVAVVVAAMRVARRR